MLKRNSLLVMLSFACFSTSYAAFEADIAAVFLRPGASNLNYVINNKGLPLQSPSWTEQEIKPKFSLGFELGARYVFACDKDSQISLYWTDLHSSKSASIEADGFNYFLGPDYEIGPTGIPIRSASGTAKFRYDVVNLDLSKKVHCAHNFGMRFFGGLSGAWLKEKVIATYSGNTVGEFAGPFSTQQTVKSDFSGVGPRLGAEGNYCICKNFSFMMEGAASALIGSISSLTSYQSSAQQLLVTYGQSINDQTIADQRVYQVIPAFDAKIATKYDYCLRNMGRLTFTLGWQASVYVNAISQYLPQSLVDGSPLETGGIFVATMAHKISNYSVQGPFLKLAYVC